jgi:hypothetical protein
VFAPRESQSNGDYAKAFLLCAEFVNVFVERPNLKLATPLLASVDELYVETTQRLEEALRAVCNDFRPEQYAKVHAWRPCGCLRKVHGG